MVARDYGVIKGGGGCWLWLVASYYPPKFISRISHLGHGRGHGSVYWNEEVKEVEEHESEVEKFEVRKKNLKWKKKIWSGKIWSEEKEIEVKEFEERKGVKVRGKKNVGKICSIKELRGAQRADGGGCAREGEEAVASHLVTGPTHRP